MAERTRYRQRHSRRRLGLLRGEVASASFPLFFRNLNTGGHNEVETEYLPAEQTLYHGANHPSHILLPVIPEATSSATARMEKDSHDTAGNRMAELQGRSQDHQPFPEAPSGMVPTSTKPSTPKLRKKSGARPGHTKHRGENLD